MTRARHIVRAALVVAVIVLAALPGPASTTQGAVNCVSQGSPVCVNLTQAAGQNPAPAPAVRTQNGARAGHSGVGVRGIILLAVAALGAFWLFGARVRRWMIGI